MNEPPSTFTAATGEHTNADERRETQAAARAAWTRLHAALGNYFAPRTYDAATMHTLQADLAVVGRALGVDHDAA